MHRRLRAWAIGAALARPRHTVLACCGDGSFLMRVQELEVMARLSLRIIIVVFNDRQLGTIRARERARGLNVAGLTLQDRLSQRAVGDLLACSRSIHGCVGRFLMVFSPFDCRPGRRSNGENSVQSVCTVSAQQGDSLVNVFGIDSRFNGVLSCR